MRRLISSIPDTMKYLEPIKSFSRYYRIIFYAELAKVTNLGKVPLFQYFSKKMKHAIFYTHIV